MSNKCVIMPIGFDLSGVLRMLSEYQMQSGDKIIFIFPTTENERGRATKADIERTLLTLASRGINIDYEITSINENDLDEALKTICEKVLKEKEKEVFIEITGGLRVICIALTVIALIMPENIKGLFITTETSGKRLRMPPIRVAYDLTNAERDILQNVANGLSKVDALTSKLHKDRSTLSRQIEKLVDIGLIEKGREGKSVKYDLTLTGYFFSRKLREIRRPIAPS